MLVEGTDPYADPKYGPGNQKRIIDDEDGETPGSGTGTGGDEDGNVAVTVIIVILSVIFVAVGVIYCIKNS
jgi:hypothetical protein